MDSIPVGFCQCGCGQRTRVYRGKPRRYIQHHYRPPERPRKRPIIPNPTGLCLCGCGRRTPLIRDNGKVRQDLVGLPTRFCKGHGRSSPVPYVLEDRGYLTPCWIPKSGISKAGYSTGSWGGKAMLGHRASYLKHVGPIPKGMHLHHKCGQKACINPGHLELRDPSGHKRLHNAHISHCPKGHEYTPENTYIYRSHRRNGEVGMTRHCRTCHAEREHLRQMRRRQGV